MPDCSVRRSRSTASPATSRRRSSATHVSSREWSRSTYGTGCFALINTGDGPRRLQNRLLTTIAYRLDGVTTYALEGAIFVAGAAVQWLRDGLGIIEHAAQSGELAENADPNQDVVLVPAFVGLGAPHWDAEARGAIFGITRSTGPAELAKAALESVALQTHDLIDAMHGDWAGARDTVLRVDGGMVASDWAMQRLADVWARRSTGRPSTRRRRWASRGWRACTPGCGRGRRGSPPAGSATAGSSRRWPEADRSPPHRPLERRRLAHADHTALRQGRRGAVWAEAGRVEPGRLSQGRC